MRMMPLIFRILLGLPLCWGGLSKAGRSWDFAEVLANYRILPAPLNQTLAVLLPWWELAAGIFLLTGLWTRPAASLAVALFTGFALATLLALLRGLDIEC